MEPVARWLLLIYLPLLAPLVLLLLFTWPWKVIGHAFRGIAMSLRSMWKGYSRSRYSHKRRPFSLWRNMFLHCWVNMARQNESRHGVSLPASDEELSSAYLETLLDATRETQNRICTGLRASMLLHCILAAFLFLGVVQPMQGAPRSASSGGYSNSVATDISGLFAALALVISLAVVGVNHQLSTLLSYAATPQQLYWLLCTWERACAGGSLATATAITFALGSLLSAVFALCSDWVFAVVLFAAAMLLYSYLYFWADSMWCPVNGAYIHYSQAFHRDLLGQGSLVAHPSCCAFWELEPVLTKDARGSLYDRMDQYLWRESQVSWFVGSTGGAAAAADERPSAAGVELYTAGSGSPTPYSSPVRAAAAPGMGLAAGAAAGTATGAAAAAAGGGNGSGKAVTDSALYSSWPSLLRYTSNSATQLQGRAKRGSGSGLSAVSEGVGASGGRHGSRIAPV